MYFKNNEHLQKKSVILPIIERTSDFQKKFTQWREHLKKEYLEISPTLCDFMAETMGITYKSK